MNRLLARAPAPALVSPSCRAKPRFRRQNRCCASRHGRRPLERAPSCSPPVDLFSQYGTCWIAVPEPKRSLVFSDSIRIRSMKRIPKIDSKPDVEAEQKRVSKLKTEAQLRDPTSPLNPESTQDPSDHHRDQLRVPRSLSSGIGTTKQHPSNGHVFREVGERRNTLERESPSSGDNILASRWSGEGCVRRSRDIQL